MNFMWALAGVLLILVGLLDVFFIVLQYNYFGFLSSRLYELTWHMLRWATAPLPGRFRAFVRSFGAPSMIVLTLALWMGLVFVGFTLLYYAGMNRENFFFSPGVQPSFSSALYLSGVTLATLGYGDITPSTFLYQALAFGEALIGFAILTLAISYILNIYQVLQQLSILTERLYHQAIDHGDPRSILVHYFPNGEPRSLDSQLMSLYQDLISYYEGLRRFPLVYYYYSRRPYRAMPYVFHMIGGLVAALRWGLPRGHPATQEPWLHTLATGLPNIIDRIEHRFVSLKGESSPEPAPIDVFVAALRKDKGSPDRWIARFLDQEAYMRRLVRLDDTPDPGELYARYKEWLPFTHRVTKFVETTAKNLGYDVGELSRDPDQVLFYEDL